MASYTPNLNLIKPADADSYDVANDNGNMDKIDAAYASLNSNLESKVNASKFDFSVTITKWSIFSDSGRKMFMIRGFYKTNTANDSYMQVIFNSNDKKLTLVRKEGSGSEETLATWSGT